MNADQIIAAISLAMQSILNAMVNAGRITVGADHCIRIPTKATTP